MMPQGHNVPTHKNPIIMKNLRISKLIRSQLSRWIFGCTAAIAMAAAPLKAEVAVSFNNTTLLNTANTPIGTVTLAFTVDGSGNVTLNASTDKTATATVAAVNVWDGAVGTVTDPAAYNTSFTLTMTGVGTGTSSNDLRLCSLSGGALGVAGTNQYRIDNNALESIKVTAGTIPAGTKLKITSIDSRNLGAPAPMRAFTPSISVTKSTSTAGIWDLSTSGFLLGSTEFINFGTYSLSPINTSAGYSFGALRFDIVNASSLAAPTGLATTTDGSEVVLDWNDALNATSYSVYRSATAGGPYGTAIATGLGTSTFTDTTVSTGSTYYYVVTASDASSESATSSEKSVAVVIPAPTGLTRTQGDGVISLDWADSTSPIFASYSVYRGTTAGGPYTSIATGLTASAHLDTTVTNGTKYYYVVRALDNVVSAESANSAEVFGVPYVPVAGSALYANLDGSVLASVTADGSNIVSAWADQTANGFNASKGTGSVLYPSATQSESGLSGLDMGSTTSRTVLPWFTPTQQDQWLDFSSGAGALPYGGFSVFAVVHPSALLGGINRDVVMSSTESNFSLRYENGKPQLRLGAATIEKTTASVLSGQTVVLAVRYDATTGAVQLWDSESGVITTGNVPAADFSSGAAIFLGGSSNSDQYMKGVLGEVKVYRGFQTTADFLNERASLVEKWVGDPIPADVAVISGTNQIDLSWTKAKPISAYTYSVYRSTSPSGPYTQITTGLIPNGESAPYTYSDTSVVLGTTYYYVVTATNTATNTESGTSLEVSASSSPTVWTGLQSTEWSTSLISDSKNWTSGGSPADYANGQAVVFDETATGYTVDLSVADVTPSSVSFNNSGASPYTLEGTKAITGTTELTKSGSQTLTITNTNTYTGATIINAGKLELGVASLLGAITGTSGTYAGAITIADGATFEKSSSGNQTLSGAVTGLGTLKMSASAGGMTLNNLANDYKALDITGGRVFIATNALALPAAATVSITGGGLLVFSTSGTYDNAITVGDTGGICARNSGGATLNNVTLPGTGTVFFNNDDSATRALTISSGKALTGNLTVNIGGNRTNLNLPGSVELTGILSGSGGSLTVDGPAAKTGLLTLRGVNTFDGGVNIVNGTVVSRTSTSTLGTGAVTMGGTGSAGASYLLGQLNSNNFTINAPDSGLIVIGANDAGSGFTMAGGITLNGALTIRTFANTVPIEPATTKASANFTGGITGTGDVVLDNLGLAANFITLDTGAINHIGSLTLQGTATGNTTIGAVIGANVTDVTQNSATSTLVLSGNNTYSGDTTVNSGVLAVKGASIPNTGKLVITGGKVDLTSAETVDTLFFSADQQPAGIYSSSSVPAGATITTASFTGSGTLIVTSPSGPGPVDHFVISAISSPQTVGTPITGITITAKDASNATVTSFTGTVTFSGTGGFSGTSESFTLGELTGVSVTPAYAGSGLTLIVTDGVSGKTGTATITTIQSQYDAWAGGALFNADTNGDGVENGLAWILGAADPNASALGLLPAASTSGVNMLFTFKRNQASINANTALTIDVGTTLASWPNGYNVGADTAGSSAGVTIAKDSPVSGTDTVTLTVTKSPDAKKFARLKATQNVEVP